MVPVPRTGREHDGGAHGGNEHGDREHDGGAHGGREYGGRKHDGGAHGGRRRTPSTGAHLRLGCRMPSPTSVETYKAAHRIGSETYQSLPSGAPLESACLFVSNDQSY